MLILQETTIGLIKVLKSGESTESDSLNKAISLANEHFGAALDPRMSELAGSGTGLIPAPGYPPVPGVMQNSQIISSEQQMQ
jgi:hypothetical protein